VAFTESALSGSPVPSSSSSDTCVLPDTVTLSLPIIYIYFLFSFSLFTYLFIYFLYFLCLRSVATTEYISSFLSASNLPYYRGRRERRAYTLTPPFCFYLGRNGHTERQAEGEIELGFRGDLHTHVLSFLVVLCMIFVAVHRGS